MAILQGHTSLVGQLQLRNDTLVTGGSDGSVRVWSLQTFAPVHRLAAHDNSVTSLQFDDSRIVSGGSDGRVKVWDLARGGLVRELGQPAEAVWRVVFEEEKAVVLASRNGKTVMEVWSFAPPDDKDENKAGSSVRRYGSPFSVPEHARGSSEPADVGLTRMGEGPENDDHNMASDDEGTPFDRDADVVMDDVYGHHSTSASSSGPDSSAATPTSDNEHDQEQQP